ncbi:MAG: PspC domain-containing protein [bacterium]|nr:PspC domain-containing protein [bacterium]
MENKKKLHRSTKTKILGGVCGGIAETYELDPTLVRLGTLLLGVVTGVFPMILAYFVAWVIMPEEAV